MLVIGHLKPKTDAEMDASDERDSAPVDMTPGSMLKRFLWNYGFNCWDLFTFNHGIKLELIKKLN